MKLTKTKKIRYPRKIKKFWKKKGKDFVSVPNIVIINLQD